MARSPSAPGTADAAANAPGKPVTHTVHAMVVGGLLALGCAWSVYALWRTPLPASALSVTNWLDGTAGKRLDTALQLPGKDATQTWTAALRYRVMGDLGPQVVQGCEGWLFYRDGLRPQAGAREAYAQRKALLQRWARTLNEAGVHLLVLTVPDKARIEQAQDRKSVV